MIDRGQGNRDERAGEDVEGLKPSLVAPAADCPGVASSQTRESLLCDPAFGQGGAEVRR
jgi:hypothetical protein